MLRLSLSNLKINKLRSGLTMLGMVFGTGAVIATLSSNEGASVYIKSQLEKLGTNLIRVAPDPRNLNHIEKADRDLLLKYSPLFSSAPLSLSLEGLDVRYQSHVNTLKLYGVEPNFFSSVGLKIHRGRPFLNQDSLEPVIALGHHAYENLFGKDRATHKLIHLYIEDVSFVFQVIAVLSEKGGEAGQLFDGAAFIPFDIASKLLPASYQRSFLVATLKSENQMDLAKMHLRALFRSRFPEGLEISDAREAIERTKNIWEKQNFVGICLAMISLLTGGIGIMNVMLLSVSQRRKEIGIRKAVGASDSQVLIQFLLEAVIVCSLGGLMGVLFGLLFGQQVAKMMGDWEAVISLRPVLLALAFATLTGLVFGLIPARRAAHLDPYEALRS